MAEIRPTEFERLITDGIPLLDVRSEGEFKAGRVPNSVNIPILSDAERHEVGLCYKELGSDAAIKLGMSLVSGEVRKDRINQWSEFFKRNKNGALFCWRGGLRSKIAAEWLAEKGIEAPRIVGGYKALRKVFLQTIERISYSQNFIVVTGRTGCGKTALLKSLAGAGFRVLDLEERAAHKGSSFGRLHIPQPSQATFENEIAADALFLEKGFALPLTKFPIFIEDESRMVGQVKVPDQMFKAMKECRLVELRSDDTGRVRQIIDDYVLSALDHAPLGQDRFQYIEEKLRSALARLTQSLGTERFREIDRELVRSLSEHKAGADPAVHEGWITRLLKEYYDPIYDRHLERGKERMVFRGERDQILEWAKGLSDV